jgi:hypothetical protein
MSDSVAIFVFTAVAYFCGHWIGYLHGKRGNK